MLVKNLEFIRLHNITPHKDAAKNFFDDVYRPLVAMTQQETKVIPWLPIDSSSTDKNQTMYATLANADEGFWGTLGYDDEDSTITALFDLGENYTTKILKDVTVFFTHFYYVYQGDVSIGNPIYQSKEISVEISMNPNEPLYTSKKIKVGKCVQIGHHLTTTISIFPDIVIGRYVKIVFHGLASRHTLKDNRYYICVDKIIPIGYSDFECDLDQLNTAVDNHYKEEKENQLLYCAPDLLKSPSPPRIPLNDDECEPEAILNKEKYVPDIKLLNGQVVQQVKQLWDMGAKDEMIKLINQNPQLRQDKGFFRLMLDRNDIADCYLENLYEKEMYLNFLETILTMNLSIDWDKITIFGNDDFLKEAKYFGMFWIYYFNQTKVEAYLDGLCFKGWSKAFDEDVEIEVPEEAEDIQLNGMLELKKIVYGTILKNYLESQEEQQ